MKNIYHKFFVTLTILSLSCGVSAQTENTRPNIIVILADDLGYADVGFNRDANFPADRGIIPTPNIDALASTGIIMKNAHVVHPFCGPSRVALLTGMYPHRIGAQYNLPNSITSTLGVPQDETYFSKVLQDEGYNTSAIGKWHLGFEDGKYQPLDRGFDHFFGFLGGGKNYFRSIYDNIFYKWSNTNSNHATQYNDPLQWNEPKGTVTNEYQDPLQRNRSYVDRKEYELDEYLTDVLTENAVQYISDNSGGADPFFMYLAYNAPHTPLQVKQSEIDAFKMANPNFESLVASSTYLTQSSPVTNLATQAEKDALIAELVEDRLIYAVMTANMDTNIGKVVTELKKDMTVFNNTVIIFLSDNGGKRFKAGAVNYPLDQGKGSVNEGGHKVPMFVSWPNKIAAPSNYDFQVSSLDIYPTLVNLAGGTIPATKKIDGLDFMDKIIAGEKVRADHTPLYTIRPQLSFTQGALTSYPWKIVKTGSGEWKLYDIVNDPAEATDVRDITDNAKEGVISDLLDQAEILFSEFKDVKPAWYDNDGDGSGHPHSFSWNDGTLPNYVGLFERSFENVTNPGLPLSDQLNTGNWALNTDISDEFEAPTLNENQWLIQGSEDENGVPEYQSNFIGRAPSQFSTDNALLEDGKLKILTKWEPDYIFTAIPNSDPVEYFGTYEGVSKPITTAAVISKNQFQYGYMEIKSKAADAEITSSFWTTGPGGSNGASELDMFEMFGGHKTSDDWKKRLKFNIISWDPNNSIKQAATAAGESIGTTHTRNIQAGNNTADAFHVYGFEWTAEYIKVYIDGVLHPDGTILKSVITNNGAEPDRWVTDVPYWVWFDSETFPWLGLPEAPDLLTPAEYQIEYIRVWQKQPNVITITGTSDAVEGQTDGVFTVSLPNGIDATQDIVVDYTVSGEAINGTDFTTLSGSVTILNGTNSTDIIIIANEDGLAEISETVIIELTNSITESIDSTPAEISIFDVTSPTTLTAGDVAIVGYKADAGNVGELAFIILKDIDPGTSISLSNRSWKSDESFNTGSEGTPYAIDDVFSWTAAGKHSAGTVFKLGSDGIVTTVINGIETPVGSTTQTFGTDDDWDLSPVGDSVLMYNGNSSTHPDNNSNLWITGLNTNGVENTSIQAAGWSIGGGNAYCQLPAALVGFDIDVTGGDVANPYDQNFGVYVGDATGDMATIRTSINDYTNWDLNESSAYYLWKNNDTVGGNIGNIMVIPVITTAQTGFWDDTTTWVGGVVPAATSPVIIAHTVTINSDVECASMLINDTTSTFVTVRAGNSLTVYGDVITSNDIFLLSNSSSFSSLIVKGDINGQIAYNRFVSAILTNDLISPPVTGLTFGTFAMASDNSNLSSNPSNSFQKAFAPFDNASGTYMNYSIESALDEADNNHLTELVQGKGYRAATDAGSTLRFKNTSTTSEVSITLTDGNASNGFGAWNLIGNPYPSYLSFKEFFDLIVDEDLGTVGQNTQLADGYNSIYGYNGSGWTVWDFNNNYPTDLIAPGQGFFVRTKAHENTATFSPSMRRTGASNDFIARNSKNSNTNIALAALYLNTASNLYITNIYFREGKTRSLDNGYDTATYNGSENGIYTSLVENNTGLNLYNQALPYSDFNDVVVPLSVKSDAGVQIKIGLDAATATIPSNINIYLEDNVANTWTLLNTVDYVFTPTVALSDVGRFFVHFSAIALSTEGIVLNGLSIYTDQSSKTVVIKGQVTNNSTVNLYDLQGRVVLLKELDQNSTTNIIDVNNLHSGIYVVKLQNTSGSRLQKVILR